jgi:SPP1 family predicted phage head-tail adaptor
VSLAAGKLRRRLALQVPGGAADGAGGVSRSWTTLATLWGSLDPVGRVPTLYGDAPSSRATHRVSLRWRADVAAGQRLVMGTRSFTILTVTDPDERRRSLGLLVEEITA